VPVALKLTVIAGVVVEVAIEVETNVEATPVTFVTVPSAPNPGNVEIKAFLIVLSVASLNHNVS